LPAEGNIDAPERPSLARGDDGRFKRVDLPSGEGVTALPITKDNDE